MKTDDYAYGDLAAFQKWCDQKPNPLMHKATVECVYHFTEYAVFRNIGNSWFQLMKTFRELDRAAAYANEEPDRFVVQREVYCEEWQ